MTAPKSARSRQSANETRIRRVIETYLLDRVEVISADGRKFSARAFPAPWSRVVDERRRLAFEKAGKAEFTLAEVNEINDRARDAQLAGTIGDSIESALAALAQQLANRKVAP